MRFQTCMYRYIPVLLAACALTMSACTQPGTTEDHGHEHAEGSAHVITLRSGGIEIFMEYEFPVVGQPVQFITHVSTISTGQPRRSGPITFVHTHESGETMERQIPEPARDGIYLPEISFPRAGTWQQTIFVPGEAGVTSIEMPPVTVFASQHDAEHAEAPEEIEGISFLKEQQWPLGTIMQEATVRSMVRRISAPATVEARPQSRATVLPPASGVLVKADGGMFPGIGQQVSAGDILTGVRTPLAGGELYTAETALTQLNADIARADANLSEQQAAVQQEEKRFNRVKELFEQDAKSERELEEASYNLDAARARLEAAQQVKNTYEQARSRLHEALKGDERQSSPIVPVVSPISGMVTEVYGSPGDMVQATDPLFVVLNAETVYLRAQLSPANRDQVLDTYPAAYTQSDGSFHEISSRGNLVYAGMEVDRKTGMIPVIWEVDNRDGHLVIGTVMTLHIETEERVDTLAIPASALVEEDGQKVAYVQISGETFERRMVETGIVDGGFVQVLSGISAGEWVVTDGAYAVRLAAVATGEVGHGHTH